MDESLREFRRKKVELMNNDYLEAERHWLDPEDSTNPYLYDEEEENIDEIKADMEED